VPVAARPPVRHLGGRAGSVGEPSAERVVELGLRGMRREPGPERRSRVREPPIAVTGSDAVTISSESTSGPNGGGGKLSTARRRRASARRPLGRERGRKSRSWTPRRGREPRSGRRCGPRRPKRPPPPRPCARPPCGRPASPALRRLDLRGTEVAREPVLEFQRLRAADPEILALDEHRRPTLDVHNAGHRQRSTASPTHPCDRRVLDRRGECPPLGV